ncbi:hypothetical protein TBLA_0A04440 [Henningerozyma blattae CBS 6284]|uniref:Phosphodiesterase n=1 Tax=Henningerozyma blattae (strain ATCC 34711 / CBS 6284 / DSM 70876 / NBRC 10599 / NRRL Y-10934 / UCD 77-7) TaxID=1071380 RepID=I2GVT6_HENB6|nr:hypothetical protein TBLA_0A04440 [Tetrapisispora blattae CBS 6284]CCH58238.1 hypothetical protein TBLA_0A04440 [Tetrapisispora blattae CBS 6284]
MSTIFYISIPPNDERRTLLKPTLSVFDRIIELDGFQSLFKQIYNDRVLDANYNYENGVSIILYDPAAYTSTCKDDLSIRHFNKVLKRFLPVLNLKCYDINTTVPKDLVHLHHDLIITDNRIFRMHHWMYDNLTTQNNTNSNNKNNTSVEGDDESNFSCSSSIYKMIDHLTFFNRLNTTDPSESSALDDHIIIPEFLKSLNYESLIIENEINNETSILDLDYFTLFNDWDFPANNLSIKQLLICSFKLIEILSIESNLPIQKNNLFLLLFTLEASYHQVNKFHNFKHAVDVMQATWKLSTLTLNNFPNFNILKLLLSLAAIGHDLGHPGTNNQIICKNDSKISKEFHNKSVLENFHQTVFIKLLNDQWPNLIIKMNSILDFNIIRDAILATDMALHNNYVSKLKEINSTPKIQNITTSDAKNPNQQIDLKTLISLIIKAADISNVTRPLDISAQWAFLITLEFNDFNLLEKYFNIKSNLNINKHLLKDTSMIKDISDLMNNDIIQNLTTANINNTNDDDDDNDTYDTTEDELIASLNEIKSLPSLDTINNDIHLTLDALIEKYPSIINGQLFFIDTFASGFFEEFSKALPQLNFLSDNIKSNRDYWLSKRK